MWFRKETNKDKTLKEYKNLLTQQRVVDRQLSNLQREKDFKVQRLEKKYQEQIDELIIAKKQIDKDVADTKEFIKNISNTTFVIPESK